MNGLGNLGNTCFLNSCLQALFATTELGQLLDKQRNIKDIPDARITNEWNELRQMMTQGTVIPRQFVFHIQQIAKLKKKDIFTGWSQNDMPEFLLFMLDCIHNSISRKVNINIKGTSKNTTDDTAVKCYTMLKDTYAKEYSEMMDLFFGIYVSSIKSENGRITHSIKPESFFILDLPIQGDCRPPCDPPAPKREGWEGNRRFPPSIRDCFDLMTETENLSGENAWLNEKTGKKESIQKQMRFWSLPKVLVIVLKRFSPDGRSKMTGLVNFPMTGLDLSKYVCGYNPKSYVYDLYAVCNHMGGVMGGHYTAYAKKDGVWYHCNDQSVSQIDANVVVSPAAYCLFYRCRGTTVPPATPLLRKEGR